MGIHKIGHQSSRHGKSFSSFKGVHKEIVDNPTLTADSGDDSDDYELTEFNCELGMVEGQLCSIPYELYDLPDLSEILSLDTWNSCLTEEERFHLAAYLPDMDQETFCLTMKEIFYGSDLYFGNPLDVFFKRLKGGFYPPKVAHIRDALHFVKRNKYYHSLRSYNDRMIQMFIDMRSLWDQCEMSSSIEERISIWSKKRKQRVINLLDLNKSPRDDHQLSQEISLEMEAMKSVGIKRAKGSLPSPSVNDMKCLAPNFRGKGLLKAKASENGLFPSHNRKVIGSKIPENFRPMPKGVLKIVPKISSVHRQQSESLPRGVQPAFLVRSQGLQDMKFSSLPAYLRFPDAVGLFESPFLRQNVAESGIHSTPNHENRKNHHESTTRTSYPSENSTVEMRQIVSSLANISMLGKHKFFADDVKRDQNEVYKPGINPADARRYTHGLGGEILWPNLQNATDDSSLRSLESYPFGIQSHSGEQNMALLKEKHINVYPRIPEAVSRTILTGNGKQEMLVASSDLMRHESNISSKKSEKQLSKPYVLEGSKDEAVVPLTYKRRKAVAKINKLDTGKTILAGADFSSNQHFGEGSKAVKIRFTGWKDMALDHEP
ncbi:uncharacterized protein [Euphorbia lathyris]|uniref:uncharacterized protein n=1 Tax=Euphorbia lathyris TaxID=212925 RepID=UPI0033136E3C